MFLLSRLMDKTKLIIIGILCVLGLGLWQFYSSPNITQSQHHSDTVTENNQHTEDSIQKLKDSLKDGDVWEENENIITIKRKNDRTVEYPPPHSRDFSHE